MGQPGNSPTSDQTNQIVAFQATRPSFMGEANTKWQLLKDTQKNARATEHLVNILFRLLVQRSSKTESQREGPSPPAPHGFLGAGHSLHLASGFQSSKLGLSAAILPIHRTCSMKLQCSGHRQPSWVPDAPADPVSTSHHCLPGELVYVSLHTTNSSSFY